MRRVRRAATVLALLAPVACGGRGGPPSLATVLERQPARLVEPGADFVIGDAPFACGGPRHTVLVLLDERTGATRWEREVPWSPGAPAVIGDRALAVSDRIDGNPPSITATDLATGDPLWQRFVASESLQAAGPIGAVQVVGTDDEDELLVVDGAGVADPLGEEAGRAALAAEAPGPFVVVAPGGRSGLVVLDDGDVRWLNDVVGAGPDQVLVAEEDGRISSHGAHEWESRPVVAGEHTIVDQVVVADGTMAVLVRAPVGPDRRLVVLDAATGAERWSHAPVRDATVAGDVVVYDVRRASGPTRQVHLADAATGAERASMASGAVLGGFVGSDGGAGWVFAGAEADGAPIATVVADPAAAPTAVLPDGVVDVSPVHAVTDTSVVVGGDRTVRAITLAGDERWEVALDRPVRHLAASPEGVLASTGDEEFGCD